MGPGVRVIFLEHLVLRPQPERDSDYTQYLRATWVFFGELVQHLPGAGDRGFAPFEDDQRNFYQELRLESKDPRRALRLEQRVFYSHLKENVPESIVDPTLNNEIITLPPRCRRRTRSLSVRTPGSPARMA